MNYVKLLEKEITETTFSNAQELKVTLDKALETIKSRDEIKKDFIEAGLFSEVDATQTGFYTHFLKLYNDINASYNNINNQEIKNTEIEYASLTDSDLYYLVESNDVSIPEIAKKNAKDEIERRKKLEENNKNLENKEKPKQYVLMPNKSSNGFTSFLMLTLITSIYGIGFLTYLYLLIK